MQIHLYMWIFFSKYVVQDYTIHAWLNLQKKNYRFRESTIKLYIDFKLGKGWVPLTTLIVQQSTVH